MVVVAPVGAHPERQAVLRAGTAVMEGRTGVPRVRCVCGNPLLPSTEARAPRWVGDQWAGWDPELTQVVFVDVEVEVFVLVDVVTEERFERPVRTNGDADTDEGGEPEAEPVPQPEPAPQTVDCGGAENTGQVLATGPDCDTGFRVGASATYPTAAAGVPHGAPEGFSCVYRGNGSEPGVEVVTVDRSRSDASIDFIDVAIRVLD